MEELSLKSSSILGPKIPFRPFDLDHWVFTTYQRAQDICCVEIVKKIFLICFYPSLGRVVLMHIEFVKTLLCISVKVCICSCYTTHQIYKLMFSQIHEVFTRPTPIFNASTHYFTIFFFSVKINLYICMLYIHVYRISVALSTGSYSLAVTGEHHSVVPGMGAHLQLFHTMIISPTRDSRRLRI